MLAEQQAKSVETSELDISFRDNFLQFLYSCGLHTAITGCPKASTIYT